MTAKPAILMIDDDLDIQNFLLHALKNDYQCKAVNNISQAMSELKFNPTLYKLILTDIQLPGISGLKLTDSLREKRFKIPVILMTAFGNLENAVSAMKNGAYDYILKPLNLDDLKISIQRALRVSDLEKDNLRLRTEIKKTSQFENIIGKSPAIVNIFELIKRIAPTEANVFITGETGTGKEVFARAIHQLSGRAAKPFIAINCSAIPAELLESELFGHAKGSFTGAFQDKKGLFEEAEGGTVFLDEIGDMQVSLQAKLLRVIQERKIKPVGDNKLIDIDIRILSATHKDLNLEIKQGLFREDLFYRLCVIPIELPALRQRKSDIPLLIDYFVKKYCHTHGVKINGFTDKTLQKLMDLPWDGNVRELENFVERSTILCDHEWMEDEHIPFISKKPINPSFIDDQLSKNLTLDEVEKQYISLILKRTGMNKEKTAQILGINRKTLYRKEKEYLASQPKTEALFETP